LNVGQGDCTFISYFSIRSLCFLSSFLFFFFMLHAAGNDKDGKSLPQACNNVLQKWNGIQFLIIYRPLNKWCTTRDQRAESGPSRFQFASQSHFRQEKTKNTQN
jgi:hypothetical protein